MFIITKKAKDAFNFGVNFSNTNTTVICNDKSKKLYLHGNLILWTNERGNTCFCLRGWDTKTTCERLRAFLPIHHKRGQLYWDNVQINDYDEYELSYTFENGIRKITK